MNVDDAARATGLSKYYLRHEIAAGNVPHIRTGKNGRCIRINVPALLRKLGATQD